MGPEIVAFPHDGLDELLEIGIIQEFTRKKERRLPKVFIEHVENMVAALRETPAGEDQGDFLFVHGSPLDPAHDYFEFRDLWRLHACA